MTKSKIVAFSLEGFRQLEFDIKGEIAIQLNTSPNSCFLVCLTYTLCVMFEILPLKAQFRSKSLIPEKYGLPAGV